VELDLWSTSPGRANVSGCDLAEAAPLPGGQLLVIVVDACGEGMVAARDAWKVLFVVRSFLAAGVPLEEVVHRATVALAGEVHPPASSLVAAMVDSSTGTVRVVGAGHPPPLLVRADGSSDWLGVGGPGIGDLPSPGADGQDGTLQVGVAPRPVVTAALHPGDTLVLYSDGVVDGDRELVDAMSLLQSASTARRRVAMAGWAKGLLSSVQAGLPVQSDATVLALRRTGNGSHDSSG
jgi:serine phosphatase RsbU (regulator of sigma subunit)